MGFQVHGENMRASASESGAERLIETGGVELCAEGFGDPRQPPIQVGSEWAKSSAKVAPGPRSRARRQLRRIGLV
jgi:hypothetical protein